MTVLRFNFLTRLRLILIFARALKRLRWHQCPECNGDAPAVDTCVVCQRWSQMPGNVYPPSWSRKNYWLQRWYELRAAELSGRAEK